MGIPLQDLSTEMGITGELVRSVFSKSRSVSTHESNVRNNMVDKRRWSSVRSYLCGDEFNSVLAEEDSASVRSSEATVTQPIPDELTDEGDLQSKEAKKQQKQNSASNFFSEEEAAIVIQSAFRGFLARRRNEGTKVMDGGQELLLGIENPSRESVDTSLEVQTGNSVEVLSDGEGSVAAHARMQHKARAQATKFKDDWDDSTVSSKVLKMRIQNRMEATTRRERALAYAFAQQLRICSKKKQTRSDGEETNMGWSWLERWMATRLPGSSSVEDHVSGQLEPTMSIQSSVMRKNFFDVGGEERESCGSNEVAAQIDNFPVISPKVKDSSKHPKLRLKVTRGVSRRKTVPNNHCPKENTKVSKKDRPRLIRSASKNNQEFTERSNAKMLRPTINRTQ